MKYLGSILAVLMGIAVQTAGAEPVHPAVALVEDTANKIQAQLRAEREVVTKNPKRVYELVEQIVLPNFDFSAMSASVLGKHWRGASAEQKQRFTQEFKVLLVRTYAKALVDNMDRKITTLPLRAAKDANDVTVRTEIPQQGGFPLPINYSMELKDGAWKVYDVDIDGISMVKNYRTTFANEVKQGGIDDLIKKLTQRNQQAANE